MKQLIKQIYKNSKDKRPIKIIKALFADFLASVWNHCLFQETLYENKLHEFHFIMDYMSSKPSLKFLLINYKLLPKNILYKLAKSKDSRTRISVAHNLLNYPKNKDIFELLAKDKLVGVRKQIAGNFETDISILLLLTKDPSITVRTKANSMFKQ